MMGLLLQMKVLMWKNWLLQRSRVFLLILEILMPLVAALVVGSSGESFQQQNATMYQEYNVSIAAGWGSRYVLVFYQPKTPVTDLIMEKFDLLWERSYENKRNKSVYGFTSEQELSQLARDLVYQHYLIFVFQGVSAQAEFPPHLTVILRPPNFDNNWWCTGKVSYGDYDEMSNRYRSSGLVFFQGLLGEAVLQYWLGTNGSQKSPDLRMFTKGMADFPPVKQAALQWEFFPILLAMTFSLNAITMTRYLASEKEKRMKQSMRLMGLSILAYRLSWLATFCCKLVPLMLLLTIILCTNLLYQVPTMELSSPSLFLAFLLCYLLSLISFSFMIAACVSSESVAAHVSGILFFISLFIYIRVRNHGPYLALAGCLSFNAAFVFGMEIIGKLERDLRGADWSTMDAATDDHSLSLSICMYMMLVDSLLFALMTWYLENIMPGKYGVPRPYTFCFQKSFWIKSHPTPDDENSMIEHQPKNKYFESTGKSMNVGINICHLTKVFAGGKVAVDDVSLKLNKGQITVLIGHHGAGKTTLISMLIGFIPPTSGTAYISGYEINKNLPKVQSVLGVCPQRDILFDRLTVWENLCLFAKLKGYSSFGLKEEVSALSSKLGLKDQLQTQAEMLSGGQRRLLSVGIALVGGSQVVILDEPSSGMDPAARRQIWNLLQEVRPSRTILLTTQYMDEAESLGDRIAIMSEGVVKCFGSPVFLKNLFDSGSHLLVVQHPQSDVQLLIGSIQQRLPEIRLENIVNNEITFFIPANKSYIILEFFKYLEDNEKTLNILSCESTPTTIEEVFIKVVDNMDVEDPLVLHSGASIAARRHTGKEQLTKKMTEVKEDVELASSSPSIPEFNRGYIKARGLLLGLSQLQAVLVKKFIIYRRSGLTSVLQLLFPIVFPFLLIDMHHHSAEELLVFDLAPFGHTLIPYSHGLNPSGYMNSFKEVYAKQFRSSHTLDNISEQTSSIDSYTVEKFMELKVSRYKKHIVIGLDALHVDPNGIISAIAYFNQYDMHSEPIAMNYMINGFIQFILDGSYSLQFVIHPLHDDEVENHVNEEELKELTAWIALAILLTMAFFGSLFIYSPIKERQVGAKHLMFVSGLKPEPYWLATLLADLLVFFLVSLCLFVILGTFQVQAFLEQGRWALVLLVLGLYSWAYLLFMYALHFCFDSPTSGMITICIVNLIAGFMAVLSLFWKPTSGHDFYFVFFFMLFIPTYSLICCFINIFINAYLITTCRPVLKYCQYSELSCCEHNCGDQCSNFQHNYLSLCSPGIGYFLLAMLFQAAFYFLFLLLIEDGFFGPWWKQLFEARTHADIEYQLVRFKIKEDSDVAAERHRISSVPVNKLLATDSLIFVNLCKRYGSFVIKRMCIGIPSGQCFGLLGQNGAGKSTIFKMLTGKVDPDSGNAYLNGYDVVFHMKEVRNNMGYCPQFNGLLDVMTSREALTMYGRIRGIPKEHVASIVNALLSSLNIYPNGDTVCYKLSGGNKRKLSVGIALIGDSSFLLLDEPFAGMDPDEKKHMFTLLSKVRESGRTIILTSHSIEECEALCTRTAILVQGKLMCLGSGHHLMHKFGRGYTVMVQLKRGKNGTPESAQPILDLVLSQFEGAVVFDHHKEYIYLHIPDSEVRLSEIFSVMETAKKTFSFVNYTIRKTTLEHVFLSLIRLGN